MKCVRSCSAERRKVLWFVGWGPTGRRLRTRCLLARCFNLSPRWLAPAGKQAYNKYNGWSKDNWQKGTTNVGINSLLSVAPTPWGTRARAPTFTNGWARGRRVPWVEKNSKQETDQTVLTITKALTKTTNCAFRAKLWKATTEKKNFRRFAPDRCPQLSNSYRRHCLLYEILSALYCYIVILI